MQRGRGGIGGFTGFGGPFAGFGNFGRPGSLISSFFGGRDPFDDPFFTQPFGGMMGLPSMLSPSLSLFGQTSNAGLLEQAPHPTRSRGPIIKELLSDDEEGEGENKEEREGNKRKHRRLSTEPFVQDPDEESEEKSRLVQYKNEFNTAYSNQPQSHTYMFQSSTVTYGGPNGGYYTSSTTRETGRDGVTLEESKEADTTVGKATHRVSRGIRDKGHSVTRKLNSDGRVDTVQTLHNLNEDELAGFEERWKGKARQHVPGWNHGLDQIDNNSSARGSSSSGRIGQPARRWALPAAEKTNKPSRVRPRSQT